MLNKRLWLTHAKALRVFYAKTDRWPTANSAEPTDRFLANWLHNQREADRGGRGAAGFGPRRVWLDRNLPKWRVANQRLVVRVPRFPADPDRRWTLALNATVEFVAARGRFPSMIAAADAERHVGIWLNNQRAARAGGTWADAFTSHRSELIDSTLPGWDTPLADLWLRRATAVVTFRAEHGFWPRQQPRKTDLTETRLGNWLSTQRRTLRSIDRETWLDTHATGWRVCNRELTQAA